MVSTKKHYDEVDIYKGIAILLIILGHSFCIHPVDFRDSSIINVQQFIGQFNLNMFFIASGILFSLKVTWGNFFTKKLSRLVLPWLTFTIISLVEKKIASEFIHHQIGNIFTEFLKDIVYGKSFWFLYSLFLMMLFSKIITNKKILTIILVVLLCCHQLGQQIPEKYDFLCAKRIIHYYPWFLMGFLVKEKYHLISEFIKSHKRSSLLTGFIALFVMIGIYLVGYTDVYFLHYCLMPFLGCVSLLLISGSLCSININYLKKFFSYFGKYSLQYYLNHMLILLGCYYIGALFYAESPVIALLVIFCLALLLSSIMLWVEKSMPKPIRRLFGFI